MRANQKKPDYPALIDVLLNLIQPLDLAGETVLTAAEAAQLRSCGVGARAGKWYCPTLPRSVVGSYWRLAHLCDDIDPYTRPVPWREKRVALLPVPVQTDPLSWLQRRIIGHIESAPGQRLARSALKRTYRRYGVRPVDSAIEQLISEDRISEYAGLLYPLSKAALAARFEAERRPRRPVPVSQYPAPNRGLIQNRAMHEIGKRGQNVKVRTHIFLREHERTSSRF